MTSATRRDFYGALQSIPKGDTEAADAYAFSGWPRFKAQSLPDHAALACPPIPTRQSSCFMRQRLVFFTGFPALQQRGDALYYCQAICGQNLQPVRPLSHPRRLFQFC